MAYQDIKVRLLQVLRIAYPAPEPVSGDVTISIENKLNYSSLFPITEDGDIVNKSYLDGLAGATGLDNTDDLENYSGDAQVIVVKDILRGGIFIYTTESLTDNGGTIFTANGKGSGFWVRQYDKAEGVNVTWFGAVGDGVTNDNTAIQLAIDTVGILGAENVGYVKFPPGTFLFTALTINYNNITIKGVPGRGTTSGSGTILQMTNAANVGISIATTIQTQRIYISDIVIVGGGTTCLGGVALGNATYGATFTFFDNVIITNFLGTGAYGMSLNAVQELCVNNCRISSNYYNIYRPNLGFCTTTVFSGSNSYLALSTNIGVYVIGDVSEITFRDVIIESEVVQFIKSTGNTAKFTLQNCYFEGNNTGAAGVALIEIIGKSGMYNESTIIMDSCDFHNPANAQYVVKLDYALGFFQYNRAFFDIGGALTTANSKTYWKYNGVTPSAANIKTALSALLGTVIAEDNNYGDAVHFQLGGLDLTGTFKLNTLAAGALLDAVLVVNSGTVKSFPATNLSTANTIMQRDANGDFAARNAALGSSTSVLPLTLRGANGESRIRILKADGTSFGDFEYSTTKQTALRFTGSHFRLTGVLESDAGNTFRYNAQTGAYTVTETDHTIDCTSGTFTVTLPTAVGFAGQVYVIKNSGAGTITIDGNGSETIDGSTTKILSVQYSGYKIQSDGANWKIIAAF